MAKTYRSWDIDQKWLLPPSIHDFVPADHLAHFVRETVRESLDLTGILEEYTEERGYPPYHPAMMTALLLYAYCQGVYSSRRIARGCEQRVDFMAVTGLQKPDHRTVARFRLRHLKALEGLFQQVLRLCQRAGLVKMGHVSLDGTKMKANASKHAAMSYDRMKKAEKELAKTVRDWMEQAAAIDAAEDELYGADQRGDELPAWVANKKKRLEKIRQAKEALEAEAREQDRARGLDPDDPPKRRPGRPAKSPRRPGEPQGNAQRNFTDPDSRIMRTTHGYQQCYNAQAAVDAESQVIVACCLTNSASDQKQLKPAVAQIKTNTGRQARELSADADYCSEDNLKELARRRVRAYLATGRQVHGEADATGRHRLPTPGTRRRAMWARLRQGGFRSRYRLRKHTVEPVFGQIKEARGLRQFLLRSTAKVTAEWSLLCTAHNLLKLARARS
jgi:transposase